MSLERQTADAQDIREAHVGGFGHQHATMVNDLPGGYWKHDLVDHVLLVNLYFPPAALVQELGQRLQDLIGCYPSPHWQMAEHLAELVAQPPERLLLCNGLSEVIPILLGSLGLSVAVPTPSFNPYELAAREGRLARFALPPPDFDLDVEAYAAHVEQHDAQAAVVISPNNPTSRGVPREQLLWLAGTLGRQGRLLLLDESFVEFAPPGQIGTLERDVAEIPNLVVLKSLGKIYGLCGLRLGYLLTIDMELLAELRRALPIWNVSAPAEYMLSRLGAFRDEARRSWNQVRADRDQLYRLLQAIPGMQVLQPHANFVFLRMPSEWPDGAVVAERLLRRHRILVRHNGGKTLLEGTRYLRIASRTKEENARLASCIQAIASSLPG